jgi:hypothetical protein
MNQPFLNSDLVFKRYNRSDCVEFPVITGFSLFTITSNGSLLPSNVMLEGRNFIKKLAFGKNEQEDVCYINNGVHNHTVCMEIAVNEGGADKLYTANFVIGFKFHRSNMELLLNEQAHLYELTVEQFLKNTLLKEELKVSLTGLKTDRANTNADIQGYLSSKAKNILNEHNATLTNFSIICEEKRDHELQIAEQNYNRFIFEKELKEKLLEAESQAERDGIARHYELEAHKKIQSGEFNKKVILVDESVDTQKIESSLRLELLQIEGKAKVKQANHVNYLIDIQSKEEATLRELKAKKNTKVTEIKTDDDIDEAEHHSRLNRVNRHGEMLSQVEKSFPSSNAEPESKALAEINSEPSYFLKKNSISFDVLAESDFCVKVNSFGSYFWELLCEENKYVAGMLQKKTLESVSYGENYLLIDSELKMLISVLKHLAKQKCFKKGTECHIVFGKAKRSESKFDKFRGAEFNTKQRNSLLISVLQEHYFIKAGTNHLDSKQARVLTLRFTDNTFIKINLDYGFGFWVKDSQRLQLTEQGTLERLVNSARYDAEDVKEFNNVNFDIVHHREVEFTKITIDAWQLEVIKHSQKIGLSDGI